MGGRGLDGVLVLCMVVSSLYVLYVPVRRTYVCTYVSIYVRTYVCVCMYHVCVCMYVCVYVSPPPGIPASDQWLPH